MAKRKSESRAKNKKQKTFSEAIGINYIINDKTNFIIGFFLLLLAIFVIVAFISYFSTGQMDQSIVEDLRPGELMNSGREFQNACGSVGAIISYFFISRCFGLAAFIIPFFIALCGLKMMGAYEKLNLWKWFFALALVMVWASVTFAKFLTPLMGSAIFNPGGDHGLFICQWVENIIGSIGLVAVLFIILVAFLTYVTSETITVVRKILNPVAYFNNKVKFTVTNNDSDDEGDDEDKTADVQPDPETFDNPEPQVTEFDVKDGGDDVVAAENVAQQPLEPIKLPKRSKKKDGAIGMQVDRPSDGRRATGLTVEGSTGEMPKINPREPWTNYKFPTLSLLNDDASHGNAYVDRAELDANKNLIIKVLHEFGVEIRSIKATVGPTITLYEITLAEGIRIIKVRNLEDDIAMSLAATGIRIIAPMPGKGTIGIEVPNAKPNIVSMRSILDSDKFQNTKMELPIALGKTITNDVFMVDLAKIPHLLVAGATGQGKSVGLNAIITSLLYKKHPNELKIVLVDPKKVEFSIYEPIAKHFMAAVEDNQDEPIITDVQKVVKTLKGLTVLMDNRYDMLKKAGVRNIKEYNKKFLDHRLNPEEGHEFMPYIVVVIDEYGDLILTAGKEIELPITRIAQLARAVGIHMVIATQRPTAKIITGNIKANFPGRISFRVGSMIDSRTILDRPGGERLVGRGDMLYLNGGEPVRVQCAFVDTPEVEKISQFISKQPGPLEPLLIPDPPVEDSGNGGDGSGIDSQQLDPLFDDAARAIVTLQSGSTSMIQRRFSIGYNRAGRIMDQIERAGIVGAASGSKPREVLITDQVSLENLLAQLHQ